MKDRLTQNSCSVGDPLIEDRHKITIGYMQKQTQDTYQAYGQVDIRGLQQVDAIDCRKMFTQ